MTLIDLLAQRIVAGPSALAMRDASDAVSVHVLDTVGAWIAGRVTREGRQLDALRSAAGATPSAYGFSMQDTIALMTSSARLTEVDDIHMASCTTPGSVVVMTALAAAGLALPAADASERFLPALHVGYEVMTRLGEAARGPEILHRGVWPTLLLAPATAAAVMATLIGLDEERTAHALAIALTASNGRPGGSASAGVTAGEGTSARWLLLGMAARTGCMAALSAASGFIGDRGLLENAEATPLQAIPLDRDLVADFFMGRLGVERTSIKPFCSAKHNIAAIHGFRQLLATGIAHEALTRIEVRLPTMHAAMVAHQDGSKSRLARITSCSYNLALAALRPHDLLDIERHESVRDEQIARLAAKVEVVADERLDAATPEAYPAAISLFQGSRLIASQTFLHAHGDAEIPFTQGDARQKFRRLTQASLSTDRSRDIEDLCREISSRPDSAPALAKAILAFDKEQALDLEDDGVDALRMLNIHEHPAATSSLANSLASTSTTP